MSFSFLLKKILSIFLTLFLIISASFFMLRSLPGSPFDEGRFLSEEIEAKMQAKYGLDKPLFDQYASYMKNLVTKADLGPSLKYANRSVNDILFNAVPVSLTLGSLAFLFSGVLGIFLGTWAAIYPNSFLAGLSNIMASFGISMPSFIFAGILVAVFGLWLNLLPVALWEGPEYMILPVLTLSVAPLSYIIRVTRSAVIDTLSRQHIRSMIAAGQSFTKIVFKHVIANSLIPIITVMGPIFAILITGSFVIEHIFALPGMGKYFVTAFINRDYFLVSGVIIIFSVILLTINTIIDILTFYLDPKLKG